MTIPKAPIFLFIFLSLAGFGLATYLTVEHVRGIIPPCSVTSGCDTVLTSVYASVGPIPTAGLGAFYYLLLIILMVAYLDTKKVIFMQLTWPVITVGFFVSLYLVYLQLFVIKAICPYCMISDLISFLLFGLGWLIRQRFLKKQELPEKGVDRQEQPA